MYHIKKVTTIFFLIAMIAIHAGSLAQQLNPKILELRAQSVANICSMIAGTDQNVSSPLKEIPSPIKKAEDPAKFYDYVLQHKKNEAFENFKKYGLEIGSAGNTQAMVEINNNHESSSQEKACSPSPTKKRKAASLTKMPSSALRRRAKNVFRLFTDQPIPLIHEEDEESPAAADDWGVSVDENHINKKYKSADIKNYLFGHEVTHVLEKHATEEAAIKEALESIHGTLTSPMKADLNKLSRTNETISDIKGVVTGGASFAKGYEGYIKKNLDELEEEFDGENDEEISITDATDEDHPAWKHRHTQALLLHEELVLLKNKKK